MASGTQYSEGKLISKQDLLQKFINFLKSLLIPTSFSQATVALVSFTLLLIVFLIDLYTPATVQLNLLYLFPLALISIHSENKNVLAWIFLSAIILQIVTLYIDTGIHVSDKVLKMAFVIPADILVVYMGRIYQATFFALHQTSLTDALTGLDNRRSIEIITSREIDRMKRYQGIFSFALLDLDEFKPLNDTKGHKAGDEALKLLATILKEKIRQSDTPARLGGDEFVILMPNTSAEDSLFFCNELCARITSQMKAEGFPITASIGTVTFAQPPDSFEEVFSKADEAMYIAKARGKGQIACL